MMQRTIAVAILAYTQVNAVNAQAAAAGRPPKYLCPQDNGLKYTTYVIITLVEIPHLCMPRADI